MKFSYKFIGINRVLSLLNLFFLFGFFLCIYRFNENNLYLDTYSIFLIVLLFLQIHFFLLYERINYNPFVVLLCFVTIIFNNSRFLTLFFDPQTSFEMYSYGNIGFVVLYLLLSNFFLFLGLNLNKIKTSKFNKSNLDFRLKKRSGHIFIILALLIHVITYYELPFISTLVNYLNVFVFNGEGIMLMAITFFMLIRSKLNKRETFIFHFLILFYIIIFTLLGRRAVILNVLIYYLIANLAVKNSLFIKAKHIFYLIFLVPISFLIFAVSTFIRKQQLIAVYKESSISFLDSIQIAYSSIYEFEISDFGELFTAVFTRIAYFDFTSYYILYAEKFEHLFTFKYYLQSIFDNFLSPGIDFFDSPRISNALFLVENGLSVNFENLRDNYQSLQIGFSAEFYNLFGYFPSLIILFLLGYFFNKIFNNIASNNDYESLLRKAILLFLFYLVIISYGLDWLFIYGISLYITFYVFKFYNNKQLKI